MTNKSITHTAVIFIFLMTCIYCVSCNKKSYTDVLVSSGPEPTEIVTPVPKPTESLSPSSELTESTTTNNETSKSTSSSSEPAEIISTGSETIEGNSSNSKTTESASTDSEPTESASTDSEPTESNSSNSETIENASTGSRKTENNSPSTEITGTPTPNPEPTPALKVEYSGSRAVPENITNPLEAYKYLRNQIIINKDYYLGISNASSSWCFKRMKDHQQSGTYEAFNISKYNAIYVDKSVSEENKVIYLTFDCGYPSKLTQNTLDVLKKHDIKASFFVTKMFLKSSVDYAIRMKEEGHLVCNHTVSHSDLTVMSIEKIVEEIFATAEYFYEKTGYEMDPFFRTPSGTYSKQLLTILEDAGYKTVFWSIAYGDYDNSNPPAPGYVTNHFTTYHHNGAIVLMHNDSTANAKELDDVLTLLEEQGYRFALLNEL